MKMQSTCFQPFTSGQLFVVDLCSQESKNKFSSKEDPDNSAATNLDAEK